jgi:hypothetical protein
LTITTACNTTPTKVKPVVDVISPPDGARYAPGEPIVLRVAAVSSNNVARVEVHSGGALVVAQDNPAPAQTYTALLQFVPSQGGAIPLVVTAFDATGASSDPASLTVVVGSGSILAVTPTPTPETPAGATPAAGGCNLAATFVTDVTIPDNTTVTAGSGLVKTWRLRNTSECAWDTGYALAYSEGAQMSAPDRVPVAPTERDASIDVSVPFTAPMVSGVYTSTWRMRAPDGTAFGNRVYVVIRVP